MNRSAFRLPFVLCLTFAACGTDPSVGTDDAAVDAQNPGSDAGSSVAMDAQVAREPAQPEASTIAPESSCEPRVAPNMDADGDGFTREAGDCNDCDALINPGAYDFPGNAFDEDCSGSVANSSEADCDRGLDIASTSAEDAARAIGLCKFTSRDKRDWGVVEARFTTADGSGRLDSPLQVGLLPKLGAAVPRAGVSLLALSSGVARAPDQLGYTNPVSDTFSGEAQTPPSGFPKASSICPPTLFDGASRRVYNQAALELTIRVPTNARSLSFDSIFYSYEYPSYICQPFNDFFISLVEPSATQDGNIVFDANDDPIGVNTGLLAVCDAALQAADAPKRFECAQDTALLKGTGFGADEYTEPSLFGSSQGKGGASTGWLTTLAPSAPGTLIKLRFAIWDTGDAKMDSTALVDRFAWSVEQPKAPTTRATPELL